MTSTAEALSAQAAPAGAHGDRGAHSGQSGPARSRLHRFPYGVIYTRDGADVLMLAVSHQHRKPGYWRTRLS